MIVYHGAIEKVENPDTKHSKRYLDFGQGFYVTSFKNQAEKWANRKALRLKSKAIVNVFELSENFTNLRILKFEDINEQWLDFVCNNRNGKIKNSTFDIVIGCVADDDVFKTVDLYFRGIWDKERTLQNLTYYEKNNQICLKTQKAIDKTLKFIYSYEVRQWKT